MRSSVRARPRPPSATPASRRNVGHRHHRAIADGFSDLDRAEPVPAPFDADLAHERLHFRLDGFERESPPGLAAVERSAIKAVERLQIAGERCAKALDESPDR